MERRPWQLIDPPWKGKNWASWTVAVVVLTLTFLCKGMRSQQWEGYTLTVPVSVSVQQGLCVHIPCTFTYPDQSSKQLEVYWYKDRGRWADQTVASNIWATIDTSAVRRFRLTGDPEKGDCSFSINDASTVDQGRYYLRILNGRPFSYKNGFPMPRVTVTELTEKPTIWKSSEMILGKPVTITCQAPGTCSGTPPWISWSPSYIDDDIKLWQQPHSNGSITYASNITITPSDYTKGKVLTCSVTYNTGWPKTENKIRIDIAYMPRMVQIIASDGHRGSSPQKGGQVVAMEGNNVSLLCKADSVPDPLLIWTKVNKTLNDSKQAKEHRLLLPKIRPEDAGLYQCQAKNSLGSAESTIWVTVQYPPRTVQLIVSQTQEWDPVRAQDPPRVMNNGSRLTVREGNSLRLICKADGNPPVEVSWVKERNTVESSFPPDNWLELTNLRVEHKGEYTCLVRNTLDSVQSTLQLDVAYAPRLSRKANSTCWHEENDFLCTCALQSWPPPQIQWQVEGETLSGNSSKGSLSVTSWLQEERATSQLRLMDSVDKDQSILCLGNNSVGVYTMQFLLSNLKRDSHKSVFVSGFCGALLAASLCLIGFFLFWFYKQRKPTPKADALEARGAAKEEQPRTKNPSLIYGNVFPANPRTPKGGQPKAARGMNSGPSQTPRAPQPTADEPGELHYAAVEFNLKDRGTPTPSEDSVEYSEIKVK